MILVERMLTDFFCFAEYGWIGWKWNLFFEKPPTATNLDSSY
jgi:hypothetical protein